MKNYRTPVALFILLIAFGIATTYFAFKYNHEKVTSNQYNADKMELNGLYDDLTADFMALNEEYDALVAENIELDEELQTKIAALEAEQKKVERMIRTGDGEAMIRAKARIVELTEENEQLKATIEVLVAENEALQVENANLATNLNQEIEKNVALTQENTAITQQLGEVTEERDELIPIANYGQVIHVNELEAEAIRVKRNGKERAAKRKNAEQIKLCFEVDENPVAELGQQDYLVRIITPEGSTLYEETNGSGSFKSLEADGGEMMYTSEAVVDFNNDVSNVCWYWDPSSNFQQGQYVAEIYHRGYRVGLESFKL